MNFEVAERLKILPPYLFADLRRKIAEMKCRGEKVISLGIGDPDYPTPDPIVKELIRAIDDPQDLNRHRYGCDVPVELLKEEATAFYKRRFGVRLSDLQIVATTGSKDAIVQFCMGLLNPGDLAIASGPGYPTYNIGHAFAGSQTYFTPLLKQNAFLVDFKSIPKDICRLAKIMWLNYPNNPTTAVASLDFFKQAVEFGRENNILICHDAAYTENTYDGFIAPSILEVDGADEVAVEFFSLSKAFNMTGWRVGVVVGNTTAVRALQTVKENVDNGSLRAIQFAAAKAFSLAESIIPSVNKVYKRRRDFVVDTLNSSGWDVEKPKGTIYVWASVPERYKGSSAAFATELLEKTGVVVTPGLGYGEWGEGYFRISLTYPDSVLEEALDRIISVGMRSS
ncbi:MAG: aminotransferase class I/II-fold pyridoxal phosphate-dependent enzyme [SAR324 cluster bacterium]|uniref:Aminotransferase n=1 Tax=SAR324 cluster bacterium TaxID=2024889 RepID=A0A7X9FUP5_9DELT|nr:aminotransferase class I/II-fold pyridoxal phosphate-dependent enzyme [SAR324 cluster bacterium]